ncbi:MAG: aminoglycoside phosphotransferase family protein, partial [Anaerolineae bacterium]
MPHPGSNMEFDLEQVQDYLCTRVGEPVEVLDIRQLKGEATGEQALKQFGYGQPIMVRYAADDREERVVFHRIRRNAFGRERSDDRVAAVWLDYQTFNDLPRHAPALDLVMQTHAGTVQSIAEARELWLVSGYCPGRPYAGDLARIRDEGKAGALDFDRAEALASYLAGIHLVQGEDADLWQRRLRDLIGHGEGIMGLTDNYPADLPYTSEEELLAIEEMANRWRWRLKPLARRLCQVHGDFHPFNILFDEGLVFYVLDRSRGAWGEPADDVSCM